MSIFVIVQSKHYNCGNKPSGVSCTFFLQQAFPLVIMCTQLLSNPEDIARLNVSEDHH